MLKALLVMIATSGGCSFVGVRGPTARPGGCTTSRVLPAIDTVAGIAGLVTAFVVTATYIDRDDLGRLWVPTIGLPSALVGGVYLYSGVNGFDHTHACRAQSAAQSQLDMPPTPSPR